MLNRVLIWLNDVINIDVAIESAKNIQAKYSCDVEYLYIIDDINYCKNKLSTTFGVNYIAADEIMEQEEEKVKKLKALIQEKCSKDIKIREGETLDILSDEIKSFDLLILGKEKNLSTINQKILKSHHKPLIFISEKPVTIENIAFANDKSIRSNKSLFSFIKIFDKLDGIKSISVNAENKSDGLEEYIAKSKLDFDTNELSGDIYKIIEEKTKNSGVVICGNLGHQYMYEKITKNQGLKIISHLPSPIFIA